MQDGELGLIPGSPLSIAESCLPRAPDSNASRLEVRPGDGMLQPLHRRGSP